MTLRQKNPTAYKADLIVKNINRRLEANVRKLGYWNGHEGKGHGAWVQATGAAAAIERQMDELAKQYGVKVKTVRKTMVDDKGRKRVVSYKQLERKAANYNNAAFVKELGAVDAVTKELTVEKQVAELSQQYTNRTGNLLNWTNTHANKANMSVIRSEAQHGAAEADGFTASEREALEAVQAGRRFMEEVNAMIFDLRYEYDEFQDLCDHYISELQSQIADAEQEIADIKSEIAKTRSADHKAVLEEELKRLETTRDELSAALSAIVEKKTSSEQRYNNTVALLNSIN